MPKTERTARDSMRNWWTRRLAFRGTVQNASNLSAMGVCVCVWKCIYIAVCLCVGEYVIGEACAPPPSKHLHFIGTHHAVSLCTYIHTPRSSYAIIYPQYTCHKTKSATLKYNMYKAPHNKIGNIPKTTQTLNMRSTIARRNYMYRTCIYLMVHTCNARPLRNVRLSQNTHTKTLPCTKLAWGNTSHTRIYAQGGPRAISATKCKVPQAIYICICRDQSALWRGDDGSKLRTACENRKMQKLSLRDGYATLSFEVNHLCMFGDDGSGGGGLYIFRVCVFCVCVQSSTVCEWMWWGGL